MIGQKEKLSPCSCHGCTWKASKGSDYCYYHSLLVKQSPEDYGHIVNDDSELEEQAHKAYYNTYEN